MPETMLKQARILIIDDEKANIRFLEIILQRAGYTDVYSSTDSREAVTLFESFRPDLVLLDLAMPHMDGFAVMRQLQPLMQAHPIPILVLTADVTVTSKHRALSEGARDFLTKPLDEKEVLLRIRNLLESHFYSAVLEQEVRERTEDLHRAQIETLERLAMAAEYRDDDTGLHTKRVGATAGLIAKALGLPNDQVDLIRRAAPLHDVGKIGIADNILLKPSKLTDEEFATMRRHTVIGAEMLSGSSSPWLQMAEVIALSHHERWDGRGYPRQLAGEEIPLVGRIVAVADVFDALTHDRPYKSAWAPDLAANEIMAQCGTQFDENVVKAFFTLSHQDLV